MISLPPYIIESVQQARQLPSWFSEPEVKAMERFVARHQIVRPALLDRLPACIDVVLEEVPRPVVEQYPELAEVLVQGETLEALERLRHRLLQAQGELRDSKLETALSLLGKGLQLEGQLGETTEQEDAPEKTGHAGHLQMLLEAHGELEQLLARLLRRHLATRNEEARAFVEKALCTLVLFAPDGTSPDTALLSRLRQVAEGSGQLILDLNIVVDERLGHLKARLFDAQLVRLMDVVRNKILGLRGPVNFRRNAASLVDLIATQRSAAQARVRLDSLLAAFREKVDDAEVRRLCSLLEDLCDKVDALDDFFEKTFARSVVAALGQARLPSAVWRSLTSELSTARAELCLYPTKDLHDLFKGKYSGDCTTGAALASRQLAHRRFFNLRVLRKDAWIGNIYALDYSERGVLVLDRFQVGDRTGFHPIDFLTKVMAALQVALKDSAPLTVLGPSVVSNFSAVRKGFERWRRGKPRQAFEFEKGDGCFESSKSGEMVVMLEVPAARGVGRRAGVRWPRKARRP
ncbi:MAG: hypothetical protein ABIJ09_02690 [Pseudomonadota bacterium]